MIDDELPQFLVFNPLPLLLLFFVALLRFQLLPRLHGAAPTARAEKSILFFGGRNTMCEPRE
jgi:hypothetical protein